MVYMIFGVNDPKSASVGYSWPGDRWEYLCMKCLYSVSLKPCIVRTPAHTAKFASICWFLAPCKFVLYDTYVEID